jgi:uncharacterized protein (DUF1810 family)
MATLTPGDKSQLTSPKTLLLETVSTETASDTLQVEGKVCGTEEKGDLLEYPDDPFDLRVRFVNKHAAYFEQALEEINAGKKTSHWSWYIFPVQPYVRGGVERGSYTNKKYCLRDEPNGTSGCEAAKAYLRYEASGINLRDNYITILQAVVEQLEHRGKSLVRLLGPLDDPKFRSSVRLFELVSRDGFDDEVHAVCLETLKAMDEEPAP